MKKGKHWELVEAELKWWDSRLLDNPEKSDGYLDFIEGLRRSRLFYMSLLPKRFGASYSQIDAERDLNNIKAHWMRREEDDLYQTRKSLRRLRQWEKREGKKIL